MIEYSNLYIKSPAIVAILTYIPYTHIHYHLHISLFSLHEENYPVKIRVGFWPDKSPPPPKHS